MCQGEFSSRPPSKLFGQKHKIFTKLSYSCFLCAPNTYTYCMLKCYAPFFKFQANGKICFILLGCV